MKRKNPLTLLISWLTLALMPAHATQAAAGIAPQQTGIVTGQVSNASTRSYLQGAVVELVGTNQTAVTDREGRYQFNNAPAGPATLAVSYTGLDTRQISVEIRTGERAVHDVELNSEIYKLDKFTVAGEREGTAKAETLQRLAPNVKNVVSSDAFGNVADGNIGDLLQHVVGITADYNGPDVRAVSIRGVSSALNSLTMDGQQLATAQSTGTGRQFEFDGASLGNIESIEVTKAATPDMEGASIGGTINLVTKSAFDRNAGRSFDYTLGLVTRSRTLRYNRSNWWKQPLFIGDQGFGPSLSFGYSDVVGEKKNLGITVTGLVHSLPWGGARALFGFERRPTPGPVYAWQTRRELYGPARSRYGLSAKADYRYSDQTTISFSTSYNFFHEDQDTRTNILEYTARLLATVDASGNRTGGGFINPNYSDNITRIFAGGTGTFSNISVNAQDKSGRTYVFQPSVRHRFERLNIDYSLTYSNAATFYDESRHNSKLAGVPGTGTVTMRLNNIGWNVDRSKDPIWPTVTQTSGPDMYNLSNYGNLVYNPNDKRGYDTVISGKFDLKKDLALAVPVFVKTGLSYRNQSRKLWSASRMYNYTGPDGILGTADDNDNIGQFTDTTGLHRPDEDRSFKHRGGTPVWPNPYQIAQHLDDHPELWQEQVAFGVQDRLQRLRQIKESIGAAYIMGNVRLGSLSILSGIRVEQTTDSGEGPLNYISPEEATRRAAWVGPVTDAEAVRRVYAQYGQRRTNRGKYRDFFPGVHFKYEPFPGFVARLSWSTGVGRPDFGSIIPNDTVNEATQSVTVSNPDLKPQYSNNYDLSAEYYFKPQGMISMGVFKKKIKEYIATDSSQFVGGGPNNGFNGQYEGFRLTTSYNSGDATIEGFEVGYQQQLTFLPGWAKGFGVFTNFTKLRTHGNNSSFTTGPVASAGGTIAGFLNTSGNLGISYRGYGFDIRPQAVYRGQYLVSNSTDPSLVTYQAAKITWSVKSRYALSRNVSLFLDLENLFEVPVSKTYALYPDRVTLLYEFTTKIVGGITGRF